jgi:cobalamin biosynthesis Mg chelatase CobN
MDVLPTGRNLHGFDPFKLPSAFAVQDGARQAQRLLERHEADGHGLPESIAMVLWGTDNLKTEGGPIAQALALMGAEPPPTVPYEETALPPMARRFWSENKRVSNARAKAELGWRPAFASWREGLSAIYATEKSGDER